LLLIKNELDQALFEIDETLQLFGMKNSPTISPLLPHASFKLPLVVNIFPPRPSSTPVFDCFSPKLIKLYLPLIKISLAQKNLNKSKFFLKRAEFLFTSFFSGYHPLLISFYSEFCNFFKAKGLFPRALKYLSKKVALAGKCLGSNHPELGRTFVEQGRLEKKIGNQAQGIENMIKGFNILQVEIKKFEEKENGEDFSLSSRKEDFADIAFEIAELFLGMSNFISFDYFF
jgi:hypothetical protein